MIPFHACSGFNNVTTEKGFNLNHQDGLHHLKTVRSCFDNCSYAGDGGCDDGGPGAIYSLCSYGSDCQDCGARGPRPPWLSPLLPSMSTSHSAEQLSVPSPSSLLEPSPRLPHSEILEGEGGAGSSSGNSSVRNHRELQGSPLTYHPMPSLPMPQPPPPMSPPFCPPCLPPVQPPFHPPYLPPSGPPSLPASLEPSSTDCVIEHITINIASDVSWTIQGKSGTVCEGSRYSLTGHSSVHACCLSPGSYTLECIGFFGDGWNGSYITIAETQVRI